MNDLSQSTHSQQSNRLAKWLAWSMLALTLLGLVGTLALEQRGCSILLDPSRSEPAAAYGMIMLPLSALAFGLLGALINTYHPENRIGWLASLYGIGFMWALFLGIYGDCGLSGRVDLPRFEYAIWAANTIQPLGFLPLMLLPLLFPDGRFLSPRWRRFGLFAIGLFVSLSLLSAFWPTPMTSGVLNVVYLPKPIALNVSSPDWLDFIIVEAASQVITLIFMAGIISLTIRWRRSEDETRQQMKWLVFHLATAGTLFVIVEIIGETFYSEIFNGWFYLIELAVFWLGLPIVIGLAIFKYRLYDIDILINRTLVYGSLTALLALIYFASIIVLQRLFTALSGQQSNLAIVISTLVIAVLFNPLRLRLQRGIDRRFFRQRYDAEQALQDFALTARNEADLERLSAAVTQVVRETVQPVGVSVWLNVWLNGGKSDE